MATARRLARPLTAAAVAALAVWLVLAGSPALHALRPLQALLLQALLPEFALRRLDLDMAGGHLRLSAQAVTVEHVVLRGRVLAPGVHFAARTPARQALRPVVLSMFAGALAAALGLSLWRSLLMIAAGAITMLLAAPVVLAGQMWALGVDALAEPSLRSLLVEASRFLLHGGDMAVVAIACMVLSAHGSAWSRRIIGGPADEGGDAPQQRAA